MIVQPVRTQRPLAVLTVDTREAFALVHVGLSLTESAHRVLTEAFIRACERSHSWGYVVFGGSPLLRVEPPRDTTVALADRPRWVATIASTAATRIEETLLAHGFAVRIVSKAHEVRA